MKALHMRPKGDKRVLRGHRWVFSNEVAGDLARWTPGEWTEVYTSKGAYLGSGYVNPHSLIAVRLVCPPGEKPEGEFFFEAIRKADEGRRCFYPGSRCYRAVFGESDGLPGLVVDRYGGIVVYQITTAGMDRLETLLREAMIEVFRPEALVYRNDTTVRTLEGLPLDKGVAYGELPPAPWVDIDGLEYELDPLGGQKTGHYLDQRDNRRAFARWAEGKKMLDLFCYEGAWALAAASAGALEATGVDRSETAIARAQRNAARNGVQSRCRFEVGDAFRFLGTAGREAFDVIVLDPPAFAKTKDSLLEARRGYTDLNRRALLALKPGGILVSCSCSYHMSEALFQEALVGAAQASNRRLRLLEARGQALDHPVLLAMPETRYLKCYFLEG
jgi:23S rRNA (cytosine1962-C5)-methyltransferase